MTVSEQLDRILTDIADGKYIVLHEEQEDIFNQAIGIGSAYKLIVETGDILELTERGHQVIEAGGFEQWKAANKKREDEAHRATLDSAKANVDAAQSAKQSKNVAIISVLVSIALFGVSYFRDNQISDRINVIERRVDTLSVLIKAQLLHPKDTLPIESSVKYESSIQRTVPGSASFGTGITSRKTLSRPTKRE